MSASTGIDSTGNRSLLPVNGIKRFKYDSHHIFDIDLASPNLVVTDLKLFLGLSVGAESVQYKLIVKIFGDSQDLLYFNTFDEQIFAQFAHL